MGLLFFRKSSEKSASVSRRDPVCGMRGNADIAFEHKGQIYAFCSDHCRQQFEKSPESYIKK